MRNACVGSYIHAKPRKASTKPRPWAAHHRLAKRSRRLASVSRHRVAAAISTSPARRHRSLRFGDARRSWSIREHKRTQPKVSVQSFLSIAPRGGPDTRRRDLLTSLNQDSHPLRTSACGRWRASSQDGPTRRLARRSAIWACASALATTLRLSCGASAAPKADLGRLSIEVCLGLLQEPDDLLRRESTLPHARHSPG